MADSVEAIKPASFHSLPPELRHHIFTYVYPPWHLAYTQEHDTVTHSKSNRLDDVVRELAVGFSSDPRFSKLPSLTPLLTCQAFYNAGKEILHASFTRHVHVVSRMIWREVHRTYGSLLAKATDLAIDDNHFWSFRDLGILRKMVHLERMTIIVSQSVKRSGVRLTLLPEDHVDQSSAPCGCIPLENAELKGLLPARLDWSDSSLQRLWSGLVAGPATDYRIMQTDPRLRMEMVSHGLETDLKLKTIWRCITLPVRPVSVKGGTLIFLVMDFHYEFPETGVIRFTGDREPILVRKRLVRREDVDFEGF